MKLSVKKKFGFIHVRGGALVEVAHDHAVPLDGFDQSAAADVLTDPGKPAERQRPAPRFSKEQRWVTAEVGDLALEIRTVKGGNLLGHSYLSGDAIQGHRYTKAQDHWFRPVVGYLADFAPDPSDTMESLQAKFDQAVTLPGRLTAFRIVVAEPTEIPSCLQAMSYFAQRSKVGLRTHLVGLIEHRKGGGGILHFQPPGEESTWCATPFQGQLLLSSPDLIEGLLTGACADEARGAITTLGPAGDAL